MLPLWSGVEESVAQTMAVGLVDCEHPPRQHQEKILLCMFFPCKTQLCLPSSAKSQLLFRQIVTALEPSCEIANDVRPARRVEESVLLGNVYSGIRQKPRKSHFFTECRNTFRRYCHDVAR